MKSRNPEPREAPGMTYARYIRRRQIDERSESMDQQQHVARSASDFVERRNTCHTTMNRRSRTWWLSAKPWQATALFCRDSRPGVRQYVNYSHVDKWSRKECQRKRTLGFPKHARRSSAPSGTVPSSMS